MSDAEDPIGRARWIGVADGPQRRSRVAKCSIAGFEFVARRGGPSDWRDISRLEDLERFECDPDFEVEWYS